MHVLNLLSYFLLLFHEKKIIVFQANCLNDMSGHHASVDIYSRLSLYCKSFSGTKSFKNKSSTSWDDFTWMWTYTAEVWIHVTLRQHWKCHWALGNVWNLLSFIYSTENFIILWKLWILLSFGVLLKDGPPQVHEYPKSMRVPGSVIWVPGIDHRSPRFHWVYLQIRNGQKLLIYQHRLPR